MSNSKPTMLMIGTFDSKGVEFQFLREQLFSLGCDVFSMNVGVFESECPFAVDFDANIVATLGGTLIQDLRSANDRGAAMRCMSDGAAKAVAKLYNEGKFDAAIGMGGSGGTLSLIHI